MEKLTEFLEREFDPAETLFVLKCPINIYYSWGVEKKTAILNQNGSEAALMLKVNGHHWKDFVLITLAWNDTFTVRLLTADYSVHKTIEDIYFDQLQFVIDKQIEWIESYKD